ncbi:MAG: hypothetical protein PPP56_02165 [Longimonas sp.]|uniref:hypothetical protein n=1 Tax=Longimonas sp. TaxID=2039626 RepID=UPI00336031B8
MLRTCLAATLALLLCTALPQNADAQVGLAFGPRVSVDVGDDINGDDATLALGADLRISSVALPFTLNPTYDYYFIDSDVSFSTLNVNLLFPFGIDNRVFTPYSGLGAGFSFISNGDTQTDAGLNVLAGAQFGVLPFRPFVELGYSIYFTEGDNLNAFGIRGGLLFGL